MNINIDKAYVLDGATMSRLWDIASRFNDGYVLTANDRRDLAQELQAKLAKAEEFDFS
jgi:hypothetical protein